MKKIYYQLIFILFSFTSSTAQIQFQNGYGDTLMEKGTVIISTSTGGYCIVGPTGLNYTDSSDVAVYVTDSAGDLLLSVKAGLPGNEFPTGLVETDNGDFIISGTTYASPLDTVNSDVFAMRITAAGGFVIWWQVYNGIGNDEANSILKTPDNNYLIAGSSTSSDTLLKSGMALKINDSGQQLWCKLISSLPYNYFNSAEVSYDLNYLLAGGTSDSLGKSDNLIVKMDTLGNVIWGKRFGTPESDVINSITLNADSGFIAAGFSLGLTGNDTDQCIIKLDSAGNVNWANYYGTANTDIVFSVLESFNSHYVTCGYSVVTGPGGDLMQMTMNEIDSAGNLVWANSYDFQTDESYGKNVIVGLDGGFAATGYSKSFGDQNGDVYFVKTDGNGASGCNEFPITFLKSPATLQDSLGVTTQSFIFTDTLLNIYSDIFINQYGQNCFATVINNASENNSVKLFPNPAKDKLYIESDFSNLTVSVFDITGKKAGDYKFKSSFGSIDVSTLVSGVYFIRIQSESGSIVKKFIIN
jgi:hypothetical protein